MRRARRAPVSHATSQDSVKRKFAEPCLAELRRTTLPRTRVNKGMRRRVGATRVLDLPINLFKDYWQLCSLTPRLLMTTTPLSPSINAGQCTTFACGPNDTNGGPPPSVPVFFAKAGTAIAVSSIAMTAITERTRTKRFMCPPNVVATPAGSPHRTNIGKDYATARVGLTNRILLFFDKIHASQASKEKSRSCCAPALCATDR
jgi:hypothetical protein